MPEVFNRCAICGSRLSGGLDLLNGQHVCEHCLSLTFVCDCCHGRDFTYNRRRHLQTYVCVECYQTSTTWMQSQFQAETSYVKTRSKRCFGVELETTRCDSYMNLKDKTLFGAKYDCSVGGMEFVSPILFGDAGLDVVQEFCDLAESNNFLVGDDCGYHLHLDMGAESEIALKSVAYAYLKTDSLWRLLVTEDRAKNCGYCRKPSYIRRHIQDIDPGAFADFCEGTDRYSLCNLQAYTKFGTYEIRLHQGTIHGMEVCNWIKAHLAFVDWAVNRTLDDIDSAFDGSEADKWESLKAIIGDINLNRYYGRRWRSRLGVSVR